MGPKRTLRKTKTTNAKIARSSSCSSHGVTSSGISSDIPSDIPSGIPSDTQHLDIPATIPMEHPPNAIVLEPHLNKKGSERLRYFCTDCDFSRMQSNFNKLAEHGLLKHGKLFVKNPIATRQTAAASVKKQRLQEIKATLNVQQTSDPELVTQFI